MDEQSPPTARPEQFSYLDPAVQSSPWEFYRAMHAHCPVYRTPERGIYVISRFEDLRLALRDFDTYSNVLERAAVLQGENAKYFIEVLREGGWEHVPTLQRSDPPQHTRYRRIIDRALNAQQVRNMGPHLTEVATQLIDTFIDRGECDFINEFALPFPGIVVAELIGLQSSEYRRFARWADNLLAYAVRVMTPDELRAAARIELEMQLFLAGQLEERRREPRDDLLSGLVQAYEDEEPLSMHELQNVLHQLIAGGYETTTSALNHCMWTLIRLPEVTAAIRADRNLIKNFIDECLRWESPVQGLYRTTTRDTELGGTHIPAGSLCTVRYGAANRDETKFPAADKFDLHRANAPQHLAFGAAAHYCPGAALAKLEITVALNAILDRMDDLRLARPLPEPVHKPSAGFIPMQELFVAFRKI